jgi:hypothetical protein
MEHPKNLLAGQFNSYWPIFIKKKRQLKKHQTTLW